MKPAAAFESLATRTLIDLVNEFIAHPADLRIELKRFDTFVSIAWRGHRADTGRMVGTNGEMYRALASYMKLVGDQHGYEVELQRVGDPTTGSLERYEPFKARLDWRKAEIMALLERTVRAACRQSQVEISSGDIRSDGTAIKVEISRNETVNTETVLRDTLRHIFKTIGNANGRSLLVNVVRTLEPEAGQPETAAGRFARTK